MDFCSPPIALPLPFFHENIISMRILFPTNRFFILLFGVYFKLLLECQEFMYA